MHQQAGALEADPAAAELAARMLDREDVHREILAETIEAAAAGAITESGRTVCGSARQPLGPIARRYASVTLETCPVQVGGSWHTHVTEPQLLNPENSLPDAANVAFGVMDVSIVAGAETSHVVVAPTDRAVLVDALAGAMGVDVGSPEAVVDAVLAGDVADPPAARRRLYAAIEPALAYHVQTPLPELAGAVASTDLRPDPAAAATAAAPAVATSGCQMYEMYGRRHEEPVALPDGGRMARVRQQGRQCQDCVHAVARQTTAGVSIREQVLATTISVTVGNAIERLLFG